MYYWHLVLLSCFNLIVDSSWVIPTRFNLWLHLLMLMMDCHGCSVVVRWQGSPDSFGNAFFINFRKIVTESKWNWSRFAKDWLGIFLKLHLQLEIFGIQLQVWTDPGVQCTLVHISAEGTDPLLCILTYSQNLVSFFGRNWFQGTSIKACL